MQATNSNNFICPFEYSQQRVFEWNDYPHTNARGWLVIDSITNGVCGGGTFMHENCTVMEVCDTAKEMTYKNHLNPLPFGGAKAGIRYSPAERNSRDVLSRFLEFTKPFLSSIWVTGADLNTSHAHIEDIVKKTLGMDSPFASLGAMYAKNLRIPDQSKNIHTILSQRVNEYFNLVEAATGYVLAALIANSVKGKSTGLMIQGFGSTGSSLAYFATRYSNIRVIGISDLSGYIIDDNGIDMNEIISIRQTATTKTLEYLHKKSSLAPSKWTSNDFANDENYLLSFLENGRADCVSLCATRYCLGPTAIETIGKYTFADSKERLLFCGANAVFEKEEHVFNCFNNNINVLPTWATSSGNSLLFANIMSSAEKREPREILRAISNYLINLLKNSQIKYNSNPYLALFERHAHVKKNLHSFNGNNYV